MASGVVIRQELLRWGIIQLIGSATGGATNYITDTVRLQSNSLSASVFDDCYVRKNDDGEQVRVDYLDTTNGRLYVTPSFAGAAASSDGYEIWMRGVNPDDIDRARDEALTSLCSVWAAYPISLVPNAGYAEALAAANWEAIGGATAAKQTLSFPYEYTTDTVLCTNAAINEGMESASVYVQPGQTYYLFVPVSARTGTAQVIPRDVTNSANIDIGSGTATETLRGWSGIEINFTIPSGCAEITIRLVGQEANAVIEWGPVYMHPLNIRRIQVPARVVSREFVGGVFVIVNPPLATQTTYWGEESYEEVRGIRREQVGDSVSLLFDEELVSNPYLFKERRFYDALSAGYLTLANRTTGDAATTTCPTDYIVPAMLRLIAEQYRFKQPQNAKFWEGLLSAALHKLEAMERTHGPIPQPTQERQSTISIVQLEV